MMQSNEFFNWIDLHAKDDPSLLRLKYAGKSTPAMDYSFAITQIECRRKFGTKLSETLSRFPKFIFPSVLSGEQATSDILARFHTELIPEGSSVLDLTAGLGIDVFHFCKKSKSVVAVEIDKERCEAIIYNSMGLGLDNLEIINGDCREYIKNASKNNMYFDYIFIDPARRAEDGKRVFALSDCKPDIIEFLPELSKICGKLIIKASPMLDITHCARTLGDITESIIILGTPTECKELVIIANFERHTETPLIRCTTLSQASSAEVLFRLSDESIYGLQINRSLQSGDYIYEAYPSVMKSGAFSLLANKYGLWQFSANTRLLYSDRFERDFPGNLYRVIEVLPYASKIIKRLKSWYPIANIATRNFGISADALRARLGIKDGGITRIYGYTDSNNNKMLAVTEKV